MILVSPSTIDGTDLGVVWRGVTRDEANAALIAWGHKMGPMTRVDYGQEAFTGLIHDRRLVAVACTSGLVREVVGGGCTWATRETAVELSRLCAERPDLNRAALRLWRAFTFPQFKRAWVISYQDADLHNGNTYRFDGWQRVAYCPCSSIDPRTGRQGRNRWVWAYPPHPSHAMPSKDAA